MRKRLWLTAPLSLIAVSALAALLAVTASAKTTNHKASSTLNFGVAGADVDFSDPALAYGVLSWEIEYETCQKLVSYPDAEGSKGSELVPGEDTTGFPAISKDGKTYTFTIKPGIKYSDGATLKASDYVYAFNRDANKTMQSPVTPFVTDIQGWNDVVAGKASKLSGVTSSGNKLTIKLT
jgi:ABC-type transport system substrate-binding protein